MNKFEELKEAYRDRENIVIHSIDEDRGIRKVLSALSKEGIIFIPVKTIHFREYVNADYLEPERVDKYAKQEMSRCRSEYFDKVRPLKRYVKDEKLSRQMGKLELVWDEE